MISLMLFDSVFPLAIGFIDKCLLNELFLQYLRMSTTIKSWTAQGIVVVRQPKHLVEVRQRANMHFSTGTVYTFTPTRLFQPVVKFSSSPVFSQINQSTDRKSVV